MRIISFVPSWTETLHECGADLIGRTRFCIHPKEISALPVVGGTKFINEELLRELAPDLVILDREENTLEMNEALTRFTRIHVTHVERVSDMPRELSALAEAIGGGVKTNLDKMSERFEKILGHKNKKIVSLRELPGVLEWMSLSEKSENQIDDKQFVYVIWKDPWMAVSNDTFIASMLEQVGISRSQIWPTTTEKYPKFETESLPPNACVLLSSEPYPFHKKRPNLEGVDVALVNGESFSWFGVRALEFLEALKR